MKKKLKWIGIGIGCAAILGLAALIWALDIPHWQTLDLNKIQNYQQAAILFDGNDEEIAVLAGAQHRRAIALEEVPQHVRDAFLAAEDARFYEHRGIDVWRIGGALLANMRSGEYSQGASTITQQLIKLTHLTSEKSLSRKAQEAWLALQLEREMNKDEILEAYLNIVYFGGAGSGVGAYGIEAAAQTFFQKSASELTLAEGALLAAVIKSPSGYSPIDHPEKALERRNHVLQAMAEYGYIDEPQSQAAQQEPLALSVAEIEQLPYGWYIDAALAEAESLLSLSADEILTGGYRIYTALDAQAQASAEALFQNGANFPDPAEDGTPAQAALVTLDSESGAVVALIGGREYNIRRGLNRATQIACQPGSALKPVSVYAAAVDAMGYLPTSIVDDAQHTYAGGYTPGNAGGQYYGKVTLREALSRSLNAATVELANRIGIDTVRMYAQRLGVELDEADRNLALALGSMTQGLSPLSLANAYLPLANGGMWSEAHVIRRIEHADGRVMYEHPGQTERVLSQQSAYMLVNMLETAASSGSARALSATGFPVAGKTGTVEMGNAAGNRDIWTVACTPTTVVSVWMGFDEPDAAHALPEGTGGSSYPARLAAQFLAEIADRASAGNFALPAGVTQALVDGLALEELHQPLLATSLTPKEYQLVEIFPDGKVPRETSPYWRIPETVTDLQASLSADGRPEIRFTALEEDVDYVVMRTIQQERRAIATLQGTPGETLTFVDEGASSNQAAKYSILPRHQRLYEMGRLVTGDESEAVSVEPRRQWSWLFGG